MIKFNKILSFLFFLVLLVIVFEIGYMMYLAQSSENKIASTSLPVPTLGKDMEAAVHPEQIKDLELFVKNKKAYDAEAYYLTREISGIITDISLEGKQVGSKLFPFGIKYKIGEIEGWYWISPTLYNLLEIYIVNDSEMKKASINELKVGDQFIAQQMNNLAYAPFDPRSTKALIIKVINQ